MKHVACCLFALLLWSEAWASDPLTIEFYDVHGKTVREVREWMNDHGPIGEDGTRHHGYTKWHVSWTFQMDSKGRLCEISSLQAELEVTMTLPNWNRPDKVSKDLEQEWERYSAALRRHEDGHYDIAVSTADAIKRLSGLTSTSGCRALAVDINREAQALIEEFRVRELEYDAITGHGATQDARF